MKFILTDELREHMDSKELKGISLVTKIRSCWSRTYAEVSAKFGDKPVGTDVDTYDVDGITIYVQKGIQAEKGIVTLDIEKLLFMERIAVKGLEQV